jgi:hypothetical protein
LEVLARDVFHDDEVCSVGLSQVVHAADIFVGNMPGKAEFVAETIDSMLVARYFGAEDFQGDFLVDFCIQHAVKAAHASPAEFFDDLVPFGKNGPPAQFSDRCGERFSEFFIFF